MGAGMDEKYAKDVPQVEPLGFVAKTQGEQSCRLALRLLTWPAGQMEGAPHPETSEEETSGARVLVSVAYPTANVAAGKTTTWPYMVFGVLPAKNINLAVSIYKRASQVAQW